MLQKVPKASIAKASWKLNNMVIPGMKATPMSCFFGRRTRGHLPNLFNHECQIVETIQKRISNQFNLAQKRGHFNNDTFSVGDRGRVQDPASRKWNILGVVSSKIGADNGSTKSYEVKADSGQVLVRNGTHIKHSEKSAVPEQSSWLSKRNGPGFSTHNSLVIRWHLWPDMPRPIKLYKKVNIIFVSHIMVTTSVITFVAYPILPEFLQLGFDSFTENLVTIGESIQF